MGKHFWHFFLILLLSFIFSGCVDMGFRIKINEDGTGSYSIAVKTDPMFMGSMNKEPIFTKGQNVKIRDMIENGKYVHIEEKNFTNISELLQDKEISLQIIKKDIRKGWRNVGNLIRFTFEATSKTGNKQKDENLAASAYMLTNSYLNFVLELPGDIKEAHHCFLDNLEVIPEFEKDRIIYKIPLALVITSKHIKIQVDFLSKLKLPNMTEKPEPIGPPSTEGTKPVKPSPPVESPPVRPPPPVERKPVQPPPSESAGPIPPSTPTRTKPVQPSPPEKKKSAKTSLPEIEDDKCYVTFFDLQKSLSTESDGYACVHGTTGCKENFKIKIDEGYEGSDKCFSIPANEGKKMLSIKKGISPLTIYKQELVFESDVSCREPGIKPNIYALIRKYAPVFQFAKNEEYHPVRIEEVFDEAVGPNRTGAGYNTPFTDSFPTSTWFGSEQKASKYFGVKAGSEFALKMMSYRGAENSKLAFNGEPLTSRNRKMSIYATHKAYPGPGNKLALQYWFFYAFDPKQTDNKNVDIDLFSHHGDWEMITVLLGECNSDYSSCTPDKVGFSIHKENLGFECQEGECADNNEYNLKDKWETPGLRLPWRHLKRQGDHVYVYVAKGSHASYPLPGKYIIYKSKLKNPFGESAGGGLEMHPDEYEMIVLPRMCEVVSDHEFGWLLFSGQINQEYAGKILHSFTFPAVDDRWLDPVKWVNEQYDPIHDQEQPSAKDEGGVSGFIKNIIGD